MINYKPLLHELIERDEGKREFAAAAGISQSTFDRMMRGCHVSTEIIERICSYLNVSVERVIRIIPEPDKAGRQAADE